MLRSTMYISLEDLEMEDYGRWKDIERMDSAMDHREGEISLWQEEVQTLRHQVTDLQKCYALAMDLVKAAPPEALAAVISTHAPLAKQDEYPSTRDLAEAMLVRSRR